MSNGWYITSSRVVTDVYTGKLTKVVNPKWKCPFCGAKYNLTTGSRTLVIDDRPEPDNKGSVIVLPITYGLHQWDKAHPEHELEKQVEALLDWLRMVSLMDQLTDVDTETIKAAIERTNYMVVNRLKASVTVKHKKTVNICTDSVPYPTSGAKIVSMAPELSLAVIGSVLPVIEVPGDLACPTLQEMAGILTLIGHMVAEQTPPTHTIADLGDTTKAIPNIYAKGTKALEYCSSKVHMWATYGTSS